MHHRSLIALLSLASLGLFGFYDSAPARYEVKQTESSLDPKINLKLSCSGNFNLNILIQNFKATPITFSLDQIQVENSPTKLELFYSSLKSNLSLRPQVGFAKDSALIQTQITLNYGEAYEAQLTEKFSSKVFTVSIAVQDEEKIGTRKFTCSPKP